jgi:holo-[acyl-carrier protein] synthase
VIIGLGIDMVKVSRFRVRTEGVANRILSEQEFKFWRNKGSNSLEHLAGRFAAKEAFAKALGTGIGHKCSFHDIQIFNNNYGQPLVLWNEKISLVYKNLICNLSITHTKEYALANVVLEV